MGAEAKARELGLEFPDDAERAYLNMAARTGNLVITSGHTSTQKGKLGQDVTVEQGYEAARLVGINILARIKGELGDLDKVKRIVKILAMVNCTPDFTNPPAVANGCSDLMVEVFGDIGRHARSAVGLTALPGNIPVEIEVIVEV